MYCEKLAADFVTLQHRLPAGPGNPGRPGSPLTPGPPGLPIAP